MRYQELREGRTRLENAIKYVQALQGNGDNEIDREVGMNILRSALASVRLEIKRPDLFELDGAFRRRTIRYA